MDTGEVPGFDVSRPNAARVYDAMLGGKDNFAADREFLAGVLRFAPMAPLGAVANRQFLCRVVQYLTVEAEVVQFLDLGSGLPGEGDVSEIAHQFRPSARIVHVDHDPVVYAHGKALLVDAETTGFVLGDLRRPAEILADPVVRSLLDLGQPVGLLLFAVLPHVADADRPALRAVTQEGEKLHSGALGGLRWREDREILSWLGDWELVEPGLVPLAEWRPLVSGQLPYPELRYTFSGVVARKR
jgi:hypothetical protein